MKNILLNGLTTATFLRDYWQKKPLLIRNAFPDFGDMLNKNSLMALAQNENVQSRLVNFHRKKWHLAYGPFEKRDLIKLAGHWTLLVQGVNHVLPEAERLLKHFNFIPHARLDDLMVSYAPTGGGVGPHFDSYDVFLLQGMGKRLWQISQQKDQTLLPDVPLRILKNFNPEQEWILEPGDMLYLPPNYAHNGIAIGDCMTYSIGFRAPTHQELANAFLMYLQDHLKLQDMYSDPELKVAKHPAYISNDMLAKVTTVLSQIHFGKNEIENFLGCYLSEPKSHIFFDPPTEPLNKKTFFQIAKKLGIRLDLKSQMLFTQKTLFMNGESYSFRSVMKPLFKKLADEREALLPAKMDENSRELLYEWYLDGYITL